MPRAWHADETGEKYFARCAKAEADHLAALRTSKDNANFFQVRQQPGYCGCLLVTSSDPTNPLMRGFLLECFGDARLDCSDGRIYIPCTYIPCTFGFVCAQV
jgi:hypothetical protein